MRKYKIEHESLEGIDYSMWTGADIEQACRMCRLLDIPLIEAAKMVVPVAITNKERIDELCSWAHNRCLSADYQGMFDKNHKHKMMTADKVTKPRRRVTLLDKKQPA